MKMDRILEYFRDQMSALDAYLRENSYLFEGSYSPISFRNLVLCEINFHLSFSMVFHLFLCYQVFFFIFICLSCF